MPPMRPTGVPLLRAGLRAVLIAAVASYAVAVVLRGDDRDQLRLVDVGLYSGTFLVAGILLLLYSPTDRHERWAWRAGGGVRDHRR